MTSLLLSLFLLAAEPTSTPACPPEGDAPTPEGRALNVKRNRTVAPSDSDIDDTATLEELLEPGGDEQRWDDSNGAEVTAYVVSITDAGPQSADCHRGRELRFHLGPDSSSPDPAHQLVAVVTPDWRARMTARGTDWSLDTLRRRYEGHWVKVRGWLLYDTSAEERSLNSASEAGVDIRRATAWEIHPVTSIDLVSGLPDAP